MKNKKSLYAIVKVNNTIKSKWFVLENGKVEDVTDNLFSDVIRYNKQCEKYSKIPFSYDSTGFIKYSFGCGLTHYLQNRNLNEVTSLDVDHIEVITTSDFTMYGFKKSESNWKNVLETILKQKEGLTV